APRQQQRVGGSPQILHRRAYDIPDIFNEEIVQIFPRQSVKRVVDHARVEMAGRAGGNGLGADSGRRQAPRVVVGGEIARERTDESRTVERPRGRFEDGRLARARGAHHVDGEQRAFPKMMPVVRRGPLVVGQDALLHLNRDQIAIAASAGIAHYGTSITIRSSRISSPCFNFAGAPQTVHASTPPRATAISQRVHCHSAATISTSSVASSQSVFTRNVFHAVSRSPGSTPDISPMRTRSECTDLA